VAGGQEACMASCLPDKYLILAIALEHLINPI